MCKGPPCSFDRNHKHFYKEWRWFSKDGEEPLAKIIRCEHMKSWFTEHWHKNELLQKFCMQGFLLSRPNQQETRDCKSHQIPGQIHEENWQNELKTCFCFQAVLTYENFIISSYLLLLDVKREITICKLKAFCVASW